MLRPIPQDSTAARPRHPSRPCECSWNDPIKGVCRANFKDLKMLQRHTLEVHERRYEKQCQDCGCWLSNKLSLDRHRRSRNCNTQQFLRAERHSLGKYDPPGFRRRLCDIRMNRRISVKSDMGTGRGLDLGAIQPVPQSSSSIVVGGGQLPHFGTNMDPRPFQILPVQTAIVEERNILGPFQPSPITPQLTAATQAKTISCGGLPGQNLGSNISIGNRLLQAAPVIYNATYLPTVPPPQTAPLFQIANSLQNAPLPRASLDRTNAFQFQTPSIQQAQPSSINTNTTERQHPRENNTYQPRASSSRLARVPFPNFDKEKYESVPVYDNQTRIGSTILYRSRVSGSSLGSRLFDARPGPGPNDCMRHYPEPCPSTCSHFHMFIDPAILEEEAQARIEVEDEEAEDY